MTTATTATVPTATATTVTATATTATATSTTATATATTATATGHSTVDTASSAITASTANTASSAASENRGVWARFTGFISSCYDALVNCLCFWRSSSTGDSSTATSATATSTTATATSTTAMTASEKVAEYTAVIADAAATDKAKLTAFRGLIGLTADDSADDTALDAAAVAQFAALPAAVRENGVQGSIWQISVDRFADSGAGTNPATHVGDFGADTFAAGPRSAIVQDAVRTVMDKMPSTKIAEMTAVVADTEASIGTKLAAIMNVWGMGAAAFESDLDADAIRDLVAAQYAELPQAVRDAVAGLNADFFDGRNEAILTAYAARFPSYHIANVTHAMPSAGITSTADSRRPLADALIALHGAATNAAETALTADAINQQMRTLMADIPATVRDGIMAELVTAGHAADAGTAQVYFDANPRSAELLAAINAYITTAGI